MFFPGKFVFGNGSLHQFIRYFLDLPFKRPFIISDPHIEEPLSQLCEALKSGGLEIIISTSIKSEPTESDFQELLREAELKGVDSVIGIGGGSVLDVAKLVAAMFDSGKALAQCYGIGNLSGRKLFLACLPTTAGTGSEVSPNSILLDENENLKKAVISPFLLPDSTFVDPLLTHTVPPAITASTGIDALTHCIEVYANKFAHPITDLFALEGIRLIYNHLERAYKCGSDMEARSNISLGSLYGGLGLGPVNTAGVHALAYPLGSNYKIPHGVSNAILLSHVLEYNLPNGVEKYAKIARTIGVEGNSSSIGTALEGIKRIKDLCKRVHVPLKLSDFNISKEDVPSIAKSALTVQRLLKNNLRELSINDIEKIYYKLF